MRSFLWALGPLIVMLLLFREWWLFREESKVPDTIEELTR